MADNTTNNKTNTFLGLSKGHLIIIVAVAVFIIWLMSGYNGLVSKDETVTQAWADVQTDYQRRLNLIPTLTKMLNKYTKYEKETYEAVVNARSKATQVTISADELTEEKLKQFQAQRSDMEAALGKLLAITENYPELKADKQFEQFNVQLEGTENRIKESMQLFNKAVTDYNLNVRRFPGSIVARIFGFDTKPKFEAEAGAEKMPDVNDFMD